ncbi:hypothetical protein [Streptomyces sp. NPDC001530]
MSGEEGRLPSGYVALTWHVGQTERLFIRWTRLIVSSIAESGLLVRAAVP